MSLVLSGTSGAALDGIKNSLMSLATAQVTTSGTSIDFTGIPSWTKKITVIFNSVSTNGASIPLIQIGSGSVDTSGYVSTSANVTTGSSTATSTAGFVLFSNLASNILSGIVTISLIGSNIWVSSHSLSASTTVSLVGGGTKTLSGTLDRVRITTTNGTDTFDAGSVNILIEGYV